MKKRIFVIVLCGLLIFGLMGCKNKDNKNNNQDNQDSEVTIESFNGKYKNGNYVMSIMAVDDDKLEYVVADEKGRRRYGTFMYEKGIASYDENKENIKVTKNGDDVNVEIDAKDLFPGGKYKKTSNYTFDEYFNENYGLETYFNNNYNGKFENKDGYIYMYQPIKKVIVLYAVASDHYDSFEIDVTKDELKYSHDNIEYKVEIDGDKLKYTLIEYGDIVYESTFERKEKLTKKDVVKVFNTFKAMGLENK